MPYNPRFNRTQRPRAAPDSPRMPGWQVPSSLADAVKQVVLDGAAPSQNAFVERAVVRELRELRRRQLHEAYAAAAADADFVNEMGDVDHEFEPTVGDGLAAEG